MRTNVVLNDALVRQAFRYAHVKTKKELLAMALKEFVSHHSKLDLRDLRKQVRFRPLYDHKTLRSGH